MSALPQERLGSEIVEPDSELRAALQRVARDLEQNSRQQRQRAAGLQHGHSVHQKGDHEQSIHVEDLLDQVSSNVLKTGTSLTLSTAVSPRGHPRRQHLVHRSTSRNRPAQ
jgi:hypothetical protein